ncbi:unnamed protein product [Amoebophrya sp. A25]|nr:unnamed protein product [Amoebophrya sp. A25]|eukprot:GSA25T00021587001.1
MSASLDRLPSSLWDNLLTCLLSAVLVALRTVVLWVFVFGNNDASDMGCASSKSSGGTKAGRAYVQSGGLQSPVAGEEGQLDRRCVVVEPPRAEDILTHVSCLPGDSQRFVCAGMSGSCYVYDLDAIRQEKAGKANTGPPAVPAQSWRVSNRAVSRVSPFGLSHSKYARDGDLAFLTCAGDGAVVLWDSSKSSASRRCTVAQHKLAVTAAAWSGSRVLSGSRDYTLKLTDLEQPGVSLTEKKIPRNVVTGIVHAPVQDVFVQLSEDLQIRIWDKNLELVQTIAGGDNQLISACLNGGGTEVLCGTKGFSEDTVELLALDLRTMTIRNRRKSIATQNIEALSPYGDDHTLLGSKDGSLKLVDHDFCVAKEFTLDHVAPVTSCAVMGDFLVATTFGPRITAFNIESGDVVAVSPPDGGG